MKNSKEDKDKVIRFPAADSDAHPQPKPKRVKRRTKRATDSAQPSLLSRQLRTRTPDDVANEQTAEQLALRIWAAMVAQKVLRGISALMDELLTSSLLDDDDEEGDEEGENESWSDGHHKRHKKILDEAIADGLNKFPDINAVANLPPSSDPDIVRDAGQLRDVLARCAVGAIKFKEKFLHTQLEQMVRRDIEVRFKKNPEYSRHIRGEVPGVDIKKYGSRGRTSSKGTFVKAIAYEHGGDLAVLLTGGWMRVAKDRIDPVAWSYQFGLPRKSERQHWKHHYIITERSGKQSPFELKRETLQGNGSAAIKQLLQSGMHIIRRKITTRALVEFLGFKPKEEIVRMPRAGWAFTEGHWIFVRPYEVLNPTGMESKLEYQLDTAASRHHGLHIAGTAKAWATEVAAPLAGNSNVALAFATFFAAPLLGFANLPSGAFHIYGDSGIGKSPCSAAGQSIDGWPYETADDAFGVSWAGTEAGFDALAVARTDLGLALEEITLADRHEVEQIVYKLASSTKGPRATSAGHLRETPHANLLGFSTGEKSLAQFVGKALQEGARKRFGDVPAEVPPGSGSAFETIPRHEIPTECERLFDAMKREHGAVGREWERYLVEQISRLGLGAIKDSLNQYRKDFRAIPAVHVAYDNAHPQVKAVINRFAFYAAVLRMVIISDLLPWTIEQANASIVSCLQRWAGQRENLDIAGEVVRAAQQIVHAVAANLDDRFIHIRKSGSAWAAATAADEIKQRTADLFDGYVKLDPENGDLVLIRVKAWKRYCNMFDSTVMAEHFKQHGRLILERTGKGLSKVEQVIGKVERCYVLRRSSLTS